MISIEPKCEKMVIVSSKMNVAFKVWEVFLITKSDTFVVGSEFWSMENDSEPVQTGTKSLKQFFNEKLIYFVFLCFSSWEPGFDTILVNEYARGEGSPRFAIDVNKLKNK